MDIRRFRRLEPKNETNILLNIENTENLRVHRTASTSLNNLCVLCALCGYNFPGGNHAF